MKAPIYSGISLFGKPHPSGVYVLSIALSKKHSLVFGKFNHGNPITLPAGSYLYIGSAMGTKGSASLGYRLVRHATRTANAPPHIIRSVLIKTLQASGITVKAPQQKKRHWHIDYLLDLPPAEIQGVIAIRTCKQLEATIAQGLMEEPAIHRVSAGLGASDYYKETHLLGVQADQEWWNFLPERVLRMT